MRASRYPLSLSMWYRTIGTTAWYEWSEGTTENVSHSGVLFRAEDHLLVGSLVEICMVLPLRAADGTRPAIAVQGRIVRTLPPTRTDARPGLAAAFADYRFLRSCASDASRSRLSRWTPDLEQAEKNPPMTACRSRGPEFA